jgi:hypothetical protein
LSEEPASSAPGKAQFDSQEVSPTSYSSGDKSKPKKYMGPEQRRGHRRGGEERRKDIRFELDKEDRRKDQGRRKDDETPEFW